MPPRDYELEKKHMVEYQIRSRGIRSPRLLAAMEKVPRHRFLPNPGDPDAYRDYPLSIGSGQTISQPYIVGLMTDCLRLQGDERVLEVGTGSGYQAALLAELSRRVYTIERFPALADKARQVLQDLGYHNVEVLVGDGSEGCPEHAPYHRIIVTAAAPHLADPWIEQLTDGGRLVVPLGDRWGQNLTVVTKQGSELKKESVCGCVFVPLIGARGWTED
jgi:protein-L-isoaspartate(D-aspartate) O-methyltransferase